MGWFGDAVDFLADGAEEVVDAIVDGAEDAAEWIEETTEEVVDGVEEVAQDVVEFATEVGDAAVSAVTEGLRFAAEAAVDNGRALADVLYAIGRSDPANGVFVFAGFFVDTFVEDAGRILLGPPTFAPNPADPASDRPETWRPQYHFSAANGWINDPCGLASTPADTGDRFHLGAQHVRGRRSFDHSQVEWLGASSPDLLHWNEHRAASLDAEDLVSSTDGHLAMAAAVTIGTAVGITVGGAASLVSGPGGGVAAGTAAGVATALAITMEAQEPTVAYVPFTGCAVVDTDNDSLLFDDDGDSRLIAIHTRASQSTLGPFEQQQHLATSDDHGRSWEMVDEVPVVPTSLGDLWWFRDPKVVRMPGGDEGSRWTMVLASEQTVRFFQSNDLVGWDRSAAAEFDLAPFLSLGHYVECPDLFALALPDDAGQGHKWVLVFSVARPFGLLSLVTDFGGFYLIGDFDQDRGFRPDASFLESGPLPLDWGPDFYAAQTWFEHDAPTIPTARTMVAWMSNWDYAERLPTAPWNGQMSLPRTVRLRTTSGGDFELANEPISTAPLRRGAQLLDVDGVVVDDPVDLTPIAGNQYELELVFDRIEARTIRIELRSGGGDVLLVGWSRTAQMMFLSRFTSGERISGSFRNCLPAARVRDARCTAPATVDDDGRLRLRILVDHNSVEVFAQDGESSITALDFPDPGDDRVSILTRGGTARVRTASAFALDTTWR